MTYIWKSNTGGKGQKVVIDTHNPNNRWGGNRVLVTIASPLSITINPGCEFHDGNFIVEKANGEVYAYRCNDVKRWAITVDEGSEPPVITDMDTPSDEDEFDEG